MTGSKNGNEAETKSPRESGEDSEDESEILEESPCGRWSKRRQEVQQRDVPGIDTAYLAMDTEEGMEVVWNEVTFSERRNAKDQEDKIKRVFDTLTQLDHPNIVKLHKYWIDTKDDKRRVVFITEYMSSGTLKKFLKLTKRNVKKLPLQSWKRWCTQIISALSYLHSCSPPIIHRNLTTDTIFIQHNGLVKIGSVAPDAIQTHVKTFRGDVKNMHYIAPEYSTQLRITPAVDVYAFGICALEIAALEIPGNGDSGNSVSQEQIQKTIHSLEHPLQQDFINKCLNAEPTQRPRSTSLRFHPVLFEVHSLKLLAADFIVHSPKKSVKYMDVCLDEMLQKQCDQETIVAELSHLGKEPTIIKRGDIKVEKLEKFMEDVRFGIYPLTAFRLPQPLLKPRPPSPETKTTSAACPPAEKDVEVRKIINMMCAIRPNEGEKGHLMTLSLRLDDKMNRQLTCVLEDGEGAPVLADELVGFGFISQVDRDRVVTMIDAELRRVLSGVMLTSEVNGEISALGITPPSALSSR